MRQTIKIATDFSDTPYGRYVTDSDVSGERFREEFLRPRLMEGDVEIDIDGVEGMGSSFLEESFGGLVREGYFTAQALSEKLTIKSFDPGNSLYPQLIKRYIQQAKVRPKQKV